MFVSYHMRLLMADVDVLNDFTTADRVSIPRGHLDDPQLLSAVLHRERPGSLGTVRACEQEFGFADVMIKNIMLNL